MDLEPEPPFLGGFGSREKGRLWAALAPALQHCFLRSKLLASELFFNWNYWCQNQDCESVTIITDPDPTFKIITDPDSFFLRSK